MFNVAEAYNVYFIFKNNDFIQCFDTFQFYSTVLCTVT